LPRRSKKQKLNGFTRSIIFVLVTHCPPHRKSPMFQNTPLSSVSADITRNIAGALPRVSLWSGFARLETLLPRSFREYLLLLPLIIGVTMLALLQVWTSMQISQTRLEVNGLRGQYVLKEQENAQLLWEISHFTTLERVVVEANAAGYVPALHRRYVRVEAQPAIYPDFSKGSETPANPAGGANWSIDANAATSQVAADLSSLWAGWMEKWTQWRHSVAGSAQGLGEGLQQQMAKIDISRLWNGQAQE